MGDKLTLKVDERTIHGKKVKQLRKQGITPGVVYGSDMEAVDVQADSGEVRKVVARAGKHTPVHLTGSKRRIAMIKSVDYDPAKRSSIRHVSFHAVKADEPVVAEVPIRLIGEGESAAERAGLIVLQAIDKIEVKALPMELPEALEISIIELAEAGDRVTVGDVALPAGVEIVDKDDGREGTEDDDVTVMDLVVANVYEPSALQAQNEAAAGDAEDESEVASDSGAEAPVAGEATEAAEATDKT